MATVETETAEILDEACSEPAWLYRRQGVVSSQIAGTQRTGLGAMNEKSVIIRKHVQITSIAHLSETF